MHGYYATKVSSILKVPLANGGREVDSHNSDYSVTSSSSSKQNIWRMTQIFLLQINFVP